MISASTPVSGPESGLAVSTHSALRAIHYTVASDSIVVKEYHISSVRKCDERFCLVGIEGNIVIDYCLIFGKVWAVEEVGVGSGIAVLLIHGYNRVIDLRDYEHIFGLRVPSPIASTARLLKLLIEESIPHLVLNNW